MLKIKHWQLNWLGLGSALALMSATIAPAAAEQVIVIDGGGISIVRFVGYKLLAAML